ncbi:sigma-70 family RNA polymerase sigma factor [Chitinophagales bacterium]|jgi:RNA polymerase sigma-70 factor (ECF subfamily)|nr:sigma-70 family RNA polymerase sigma factor [Chitinophagales bacterium]
MAGADQKLIDKYLVERILNRNDQLAYATLMNKYKKAVYFTVLKMVSNKDDAEDLTMQAFTKAFRSLDKYDNSYAFSTWLFRIASNNAIDHLRKRKLSTTSLDVNIFEDDGDQGASVSTTLVDEKADPEEAMLKGQRSAIMREVINSLDDKYKELINLYYFEELKYEEIADQLQIPLGTVKVRLSRAKDFLAKLLDGHDDKY